jgi:hypothetical protein
MEKKSIEKPLLKLALIEAEILFLIPHLAGEKKDCSE